MDCFFLSQIGGNLKESSKVLSDFFQKREVTSLGYFFALTSGYSCKKRRQTFFECGSQFASAVDIEPTVHTTICFINQNTEKPIHVEGAVHVFTVNSQFLCAPFEVHILLRVICTSRSQSKLHCARLEVLPGLSIAMILQEVRSAVSP